MTTKLSYTIVKYEIRQLNALLHLHSESFANTYVLQLRIRDRERRRVLHNMQVSTYWVHTYYIRKNDIQH